MITRLTCINEVSYRTKFDDGTKRTVPNIYFDVEDEDVESIWITGFPVIKVKMKNGIIVAIPTNNVASMQCEEERGYEDVERNFLL